jgi:hypothetical protein
VENIFHYLKNLIIIHKFISIWIESLEKGTVIVFRVIEMLHIFAPSLNLLGIILNIALCLVLTLGGFETSLKHHTLG